MFAKALGGNPNLLLLDEPTRGVDVGAKFDIYAIIRDMTAKGMAVILVSSDLPELIGMCRPHRGDARRRDHRDRRRARA